MRWLPVLSFRSDLKPKDQKQHSFNVIKLEEKKLEIAERQTIALEKLAGFLTGEGLTRTLGAFAKSNSAASLLQGLTTHDGRKGLDARTQAQDAKEICHLVERVFAEFEEKLTAKAKGEAQESELHDGERDFNEWMKEQQKHHG